jgi:NO-binding membrane sensor protein with MHYT domain
MAEPKEYYRVSPAVWWLVGLFACGFAFWALFFITELLYYR